MAHAYTPGLRVVERATLRKERILPIQGEVLASKGSLVRAETVVARTNLPGPVSSVNVVSQLGISPAHIKEYMAKREGDPVQEGEIIAESRPWIKWLRTAVRSPVNGTLETISTITGQVLVRHPPRPVEVRAYMDGMIVEVIERQGVVVETEGALVQGIFGVGGEVSGEIMMACDGPGRTAGPEAVTADMAGKIVIAGALLTSLVYQRAHMLGVAALIGGGLHDSDLRTLLGYDIGVAITGQEPIRPTLIVTEGFGHIAMAQSTFDLLKAHVGRRASANGATQIRAGVVRPEIVIPLEASVQRAEERQGHAPTAMGLMRDTLVRIIRNPGFGTIGRVKSLPPGIVQIETEARVRVVQVVIETGQTVVVPRANVEVIERQ